MKTKTISLLDVLNAQNDRICIDEELLLKQLCGKIDRALIIGRMLSVRRQYLFCLGYYLADATRMKPKELEEWTGSLSEYNIDPVFDRYNHKTLKKMFRKETVARSEEIEKFLKIEEVLIRKAKAKRK